MQNLKYGTCLQGVMYRLNEGKRLHNNMNQWILDVQRKKERKDLLICNFSVVLAAAFLIAFFRNYSHPNILIMSFLFR